MDSAAVTLLLSAATAEGGGWAERNGYPEPFTAPSLNLSEETGPAPRDQIDAGVSVLRSSLSRAQTHPCVILSPFTARALNLSEETTRRDG